MNRLVAPLLSVAMLLASTANAMPTSDPAHAHALVPPTGHVSAPTGRTSVSTGKTMGSHPAAVAFAARTPVKAKAPSGAPPVTIVRMDTEKAADVLGYMQMRPGFSAATKQLQRVVDKPGNKRVAASARNAAGTHSADVSFQVVNALAAAVVNGDWTEAKRSMAVAKQLLDNPFESRNQPKGSAALYRKVARQLQQFDAYAAAPGPDLPLIK